MTTTLRSLFWLLAASVLFLALVPGPLGTIIPSDFERHFLAFLILPIVATYAWPRVPLLAMWFAFVIFGGAIEFLQLEMAVGRAAEWNDWVNDVVATTVGLIVANLGLRMVGPSRIA